MPTVNGEPRPNSGRRPDRPDPPSDYLAGAAVYGTWLAAVFFGAQLLVLVLLLSSVLGQP